MFRGAAAPRQQDKLPMRQVIDSDACEGGCGRRRFLQWSAAAAGAMLSPQAIADAPGGSRPPNLVVYLADTLRADHLGCFGNRSPVSPFVDRLAAEGTLFEQCYSQASWTKPSIGSIFTGRLPQVHQAVVSAWDGVVEGTARVQALRPSFKTLAERIEAQGYRTALFLSNPHVQREHGFARGFQHYHFKASEPPVQQLDFVLEWLQQHAREPFFLFVHAIDPHAPYQPDEAGMRSLYGADAGELRNRLAPADRELLEATERFFNPLPDAPRGDRVDLMGLSPEGRAYYQRLYDAEILRVDGEAQRLYEAIDSLGVLDRTCFVFTSDHGEAFGEHGKFYHGNSVYDEELHVPLVIRGPGIQAGRRVEHTVALFDLNPTLAEFAGAPPDDAAPARPLLGPDGSLLADADRDVFSQCDYYSDDPAIWSTSLIRGAHKALRFGSAKSVEPALAGGIRVFDRAADPLEQAPAEPVADTPGGRLAEALSGAMARIAAEAETFGPSEWVTPQADDREAIEALGYL